MYEYIVNVAILTINNILIFAITIFLLKYRIKLKVCKYKQYIKRLIKCFYYT